MLTVAFNSGNAAITGYLQEDHDRLVAHKTRPAIVICAGGAYRWLSPREKDPVALSFSADGYQTFLIDYSTGDSAGGLRPLHELAEAVRRIRENSDSWHIQPDRIAVLGFSAGGHLAASLGVLGTELDLGKGSRPDALILCYPVITSGIYAHRESIQHVTGGDPELEDLLSLEKHVPADMPPTFLWHCVGDADVPVENSILLLSAMQKAGIDFECHLFAGGSHGISMCTQETETPDPYCRIWVKLCKNWLNRTFNFMP